ncbi:hypothetical protein [Deinococcus puniceus]|uniref:Uncharacterized protein n=1 Tax=Deinococcus puniceus TaxID=1182568 RepID=A0A172T7N3_9DEIO|nr:hypothetical protein [Deinococcus puniceus]ANE42957.1 hypothetical protein SU48_03310 [Deinococcus puniceus]
MPDINAATIVTVARTGSRVVRYLIRPAQRLPNSSVVLMTGGRDPWLPAPTGSAAETMSRARRAGSRVRRMLGLVALLILGVLGALLVGPLLLLLGIGTASGSDVAGILLALTLVAAAFGAYWTARRARAILHAPEDTVPPTTLDLAGAAAHDEAALLATLRLHERTLPTPARAALHATAIATRDALRVTAHDQALGRDTYDAQQAARRDLPDLLSAYRAAPPTSAADVELLMQLGHIERRMRSVSSDRAGQGQRKLEAHGRYLKDKYRLSEGTDDQNAKR